MNSKKALELHPMLDSEVSLMTSPYICASCRTLAGKGRTIGKLQWDFRASFISFNQSQPAHEGALITERGNERTNSQRDSDRSRDTRAAIPRQHQWPLARNSRDDILESLFLSPRNETSREVYKGRYSAPRTKGSDATSEDRTPAGGPSTLDPESGDSNPTERGPSFRKISRVRRPPITTLKKLPGHRGEHAVNSE